MSNVAGRNMGLSNENPGNDTSFTCIPVVSTTSDNIRIRIDPEKLSCGVHSAGIIWRENQPRLTKIYHITTLADAVNVQHS